MKSSILLLILCSLACFGVMGCGQAPPAISLAEAVQKGNIKAVQQHIAAKTDLNKPNADGWTPLQLAVIKGDASIFQALTEGGADLKRKGKEGKTAPELARARNQAAIVQYLQQRAEKKRGRGLIDGGLGVSDAMDNM